MQLRHFIAFVSFLSLVFFLSCSSGPSSPGMGRVSVLLTDAPGSFDAVNLVVREVSIHRAGEFEPEDDIDGSEPDTSDTDTTDTDTTDTDLPNVAPGEWEVLSDDTQTFDLIALRNGVTTSMGVGLVPAGRYTQVRLLLGEGSNVVVDGVSHPLVIPSGLQTGLKLVGGFQVPEGGEVEVTVDIDAAESIDVRPDGTYRLRPTARLLQ